jgi:nucleotide-binding universal stress UspA family protein
MYKRILVPMDGSELAECVLPHVVSIARGRVKTDIILIRVIEPLELPTRGGIAFSKEEQNQIDAKRRSEAKKYLKQLATRLKKEGLIARIELQDGKAAEAIAEYAKRNEVDLIVMATHGRSGISRWYWGSVADKILHSVCIPVLMVRAPGCLPGI